MAAITPLRPPPLRLAHLLAGVCALPRGPARRHAAGDRLTGRVRRLHRRRRRHAGACPHHVAPM
eukprot:112581-Prymnesium_polylepis.1